MLAASGNSADRYGTKELNDYFMNVSAKRGTTERSPDSAMSGNAEDKKQKINDSNDDDAILMNFLSNSQSSSTESEKDNSSE